MKDKLVHVDCGGEIGEHPTLTYDYEYEDGTAVTDLPAVVCLKCGKEIGGDPEVEWVGPNAEFLNERAEAQADWEPRLKT